MQRYLIVTIVLLLATSATRADDAAEAASPASAASVAADVSDVTSAAWTFQVADTTETTSVDVTAPEAVAYAGQDTASLADIIEASQIPSQLAKPYDTMIAISPTGKTLAAGQGRFNLDEIVLQQFNYGITDRWQLGINITGPFSASMDLKYRFTSDDSPWQISLLTGGGSQLLGMPLAQVLFARAAFTHDFASGAMINATLGVFTAGALQDTGGSDPWDIFGSTLFSASGSATFDTIGWTLPINERWEWINDMGIVLRFSNCCNDEPPAGWISAFRYTRKDHHFAVQFGWAILLMKSTLEDRFLGPPYLGLNWLL